MFSAVADLLTLLATTLFPLFASYKALRSPTTPSLAPWLTFYATVSVIFVLESTILYPLQYIPFYAWFRLALHCYLLLPAPEGAARVYTGYIEPLLMQYEGEIEEFIAKAHESGRAAGLQYLKKGVDWLRVNILGQEPRPASVQSSGTTAYTSYAQQLLSRFYSAPPASRSTGYAGTTSPSASGAAAGTGFYGGAADVSSVITSLLQAAKAGGNARGGAAEAGLVPPQFDRSPAERLSYVRQARESLRMLSQAFEKEEGKALAESEPALSKSRSETEFDKIEKDEVGPERPSINKRTTSTGSWMPWAWSAKPVDTAGKKNDGEDVSVDVPTQGKSSGIDLGH